MYFHDGQGRGGQVFLVWAVDVCVCMQAVT